MDNTMYGLKHENLKCCGDTRRAAKALISWELFETQMPFLKKDGDFLTWIHNKFYFPDSFEIVGVFVNGDRRCIELEIECSYFDEIEKGKSLPEVMVWYLRKEDKVEVQSIKIGEKDLTEIILGEKWTLWTRLKKWTLSVLFRVRGITTRSLMKSTKP